MKRFSRFDITVECDEPEDVKGVQSAVQDLSKLFLHMDVKSLNICLDCRKPDNWGYIRSSYYGDVRLLKRETSGDWKAH